MNTQLCRDGIILDPESLDGRELQPDEVAAMRRKQWERKREALMQLHNDRMSRELSRQVNQ